MVLDENKTRKGTGGVLSFSVAGPLDEASDEGDIGNSGGVLSGR